MYILIDEKRIAVITKKTMKRYNKLMDTTCREFMSLKKSVKGY